MITIIPVLWLISFYINKTWVWQFENCYRKSDPVLLSHAMHSFPLLQDKAEPHTSPRSRMSCPVLKETAGWERDDCPKVLGWNWMQRPIFLMVNWLLHLHNPVSVKSSLSFESPPSLTQVYCDLMCFFPVWVLCLHFLTYLWFSNMAPEQLPDVAQRFGQISL
jgi:hypothetical protein